MISWSFFHESKLVSVIWIRFEGCGVPHLEAVWLVGDSRQETHWKLNIL